MCGVYLIYKARLLARLFIFIPVFLVQVFEKSVTSPVLVSFASEPTPIWEIPFPALTVCNMNKVSVWLLREYRRVLSRSKHPRLGRLLNMH